MSKRLSAEIADDYLSLQYGLMGRKGLAKDSGMLFDFGSSRPLSFWMKNTYIPLQIAFMDSSGRIGQIESMVPMSTRAVRSDASYRYALEVKDGWFDDNGISVGAVAGLPADVAPQPAAPQQAPVPPDFQIERSKKEILKAVKDADIQIDIVGYVDGDGNELPQKTIGSPMVFGDTADGVAGGLITAFDYQDPKNPYKSFVIDRIAHLRDPADPEGPYITSVEQVKQIGAKKSLTKEDIRSIEGKGIAGKEI